ncbi:hypothetical protein [Winogradskyella sp. MH6]|uniref:hypothetical protein n=1 Tax=Winogradskyella sp. MH6 TaxID=2929510 RepID=UPI001FB43690|nr:hypothetical protein [Winogradskyella sp. MH6]
MDNQKFYVIGIVVLLFYLITVLILNRVILYKGIKAKEIEDSEIIKKIPYLISVNLSIVISYFFLFDSLMDALTYQFKDGFEVSGLFSWATLILIIGVVIICVGYLLTLGVTKLGMKIVNPIMFSIIWFGTNTILIMLFNFIYIQITKNDAFTIY